MKKTYLLSEMMSRFFYSEFELWYLPDSKEENIYLIENFDSWTTKTFDIKHFICFVNKFYELLSQFFKVLQMKKFYFK